MHSVKPAQRELVPVDPSLPLMLRDTRAAHFSYPWHYHPELELTLIKAGRGLRYVGDSINAFEEGDLVLVGASTPHCWLSKPAPGQPVHALFVQFLPEAFGKDFLQLSAVQPLANLFQLAKRGLRLGGLTRVRVSEELERLFRQSPRPMDKIVRLLNILSIIAESSDSETLALTSGQRPQTPRHAQTAQRVLGYIHENASRQLSQREVAALAGLSAAGFSRFFSRHFGKPFVSYLAEIRVGNACRLLLEGDRSIAEVAAEVGFNNLANFNRRFRHLKGATPSAYRRLARGMASSA